MSFGPAQGYGSGGSAAASSEDIAPRKVSQVFVDPTGGSALVKNNYAGTITEEGNTISVVADSDATYKSYTTLATSGNDGGWHMIGHTTERGHLPRLVFKVKTGTSIAVCRIWCGWTSGDLMATSSPTGGEVASFRFDTSASDANWKAVSNDGGADSGTQTDTGVAVATGTAYDMEIDMSTAGSIVFKINGATVATHSTNLPLSTAQLGNQFQIRTLEAVAKTLKFGHVYLTQE